MVQHRSPQRIYKYEGDSKINDLLIGNFGDVAFIARDQFDLSGRLYCPKGTMEFDVMGSGTISFEGVCNKLIVKNASGDCHLDFSRLTCREVQVLSLFGGSRLTLGAARLIKDAVLKDEAVLTCSNKTILVNYSVSDNSQIERLSKMAS